MKRLVCLVLAGLAVAACQKPKGNEFTINGVMEGIPDGEMVYLSKAEDDAMPEPIDSATIRDGRFVFNGTQDSTIIAYVIYQGDKADAKSALLFLEKGDIDLHMTAEGESTVTGTPNNDINEQVFGSPIAKRMNEISMAYADSTLTKEAKEALAAEGDSLETHYYNAIYQAAKGNMDKEVGVYLLKNFRSTFNAAQLDTLVSLLPAARLEDPFIKENILDRVEMVRATAVGKHFKDLVLKNPSGKDMNLSEYVGKNKLTLVDFWASWCGTCRREMPQIVELYKKYKVDGLEIVGISFDDAEDDWKGALKKLNMTWPQLSDLKRWDSDARAAYGISFIPSTVLIQADGTIVARDLRGDELDAKIAELLQK